MNANRVKLLAAVLPFFCLPNAFAAKLVHGPLTLPDDDTKLAFYQQTQSVDAYLNGEHGIKLDSYAAGTDVVAVFYQDFDGDNQREVVVMLKTPQGNVLRTYGDSFGEWQPLPRLNAKLAALTPTLKSFTVAAIRKAVKPWPLQQYQLEYEKPQIDDANIVDLFAGKLVGKGQFSGYLDEKGKATNSLKRATQYQLTYPINISQNGQQYQLVSHYERSDYGDESASSFELSSVGYENAQGVRAGVHLSYMAAFMGFSSIVTQSHYQAGKLDGSYTALSPRNGEIIESGQYQQGQRVGDWQESDDQWRYWQGTYQQGKKQGRWVLKSAMADDIDVGFANYQQGVLDGDYETWQIDESEADGAADNANLKRRLESKGRYVNGKQQGLWQQQAGAGMETVTYADGKREGTRQVVNDAGVMVSNEQYQHDQLTGAAYYFRDDGTIKASKNFSHGQLDGTQWYFNRLGFMYKQEQFKAVATSSGDWTSYKQGLTVLYNSDHSIRELERFTEGYHVGEQLNYSREGQLKEVHHYEIAPHRVGEIMVGQQIWFHSKTPFAVSRISEFVNNEPSGASYDFFANQQLQRISHFCVVGDGSECRAGRNYGWRHSFFDDGSTDCIEHFDTTALLEYTCYNRRGLLEKTRKVFDGNVVVDKDYQDGRLFRDTTYQTFVNKTVAGKQLPDFARREKHGLSNSYYSNGKANWQTLYRHDEKVCSKHFDQQGKQFEATASCQFPLIGL